LGENLAWFKEMILKLIIPKDRASLMNWLYWMEIANILISIVFIITLVMGMFSSDILQIVKLGMLALVSLIFLSISNILQYLLVIEFNTRNNKLKKVR
jgi:hypothetical protein